MPTLDDDLVGGQQKQSPEEGIPEGGPIPLHRDTTRIKDGQKYRLGVGGGDGGADGR